MGRRPNRVSLKQARDAHDEARAAVARGEHPIRQKFAAAIEKESRKSVKEAAEHSRAWVPTRNLISALDELELTQKHTG